ncbi:4-alpha-glucanotransferase [Thorsellia anophelis]|uniref:4-alpha-glucanotransferase n=1 Tax=Thorsellia anophelis DSM 18579 TaxID=1123402 RepID=A0A1I0C2C1_9GAMM|nr:4-alpha-glucanotransferase [Thorsellia anophelis]SET13238.1 4-alpha-glucanotransferase [Thorsellia anophelis DSM 18579]
MDNSSYDGLRQSAIAAGIGLNFYNAYGHLQEISEESLSKLLAALDTDAAHKIDKDRLLDPVYVTYQGDEQHYTIRNADLFKWELRLEDGTLKANGQQDWPSLHFPSDLPLGYHTLTLTKLSGTPTEKETRIIVAPKRCFEPKALQEHKRLWGACVQLYTLRSENNWGVGDFGDLKQLVRKVSEKGGAYVGLNPLHSLFPANPASASPYAPSSRRWLNVIYIDVTAVEDYQNSDEAQTWFKRQDIQNRLQMARNTEYVDYSLAQELKLEALEIAYKQFKQRPQTDLLHTQFAEFVQKGGDSLYQQAAFDALHSKLAEHDKMQWGWPVWDKSYSDFHSPAVTEYCKQNADKVNFYLWLQWIAAAQLEACYQESQSLEMPIGIYRDLAVGVGEGGAEIWGDKDLYCLGASVGAPPDVLGPQGQNWGLPPMHPAVMFDRAYQPFIDLLRANMASCGALRMDHVMGLLRLWWIPYSQTADKGAYVHFNVDHFLAILALESQRHQCMLIGEDLGTVPPEIVEKLKNSAVYSYKVVYFENANNHFFAPYDYIQQAIATITTHDLPTLRGYWEKNDFDLGRSLGVYKDEGVLHHLSEDRDWKKQGMLDALHQHGCLPHDYQRDAKQVQMDATLNRAVHQFIAQSKTALIGLQPEDWLDMSSPVNIPGTSEEYPNWRRKLTHSIEEIFAQQNVSDLLNLVNHHRNS